MGGLTARPTGGFAPATDTTRLFVGRIPRDLITENDLVMWFSTFGTVTDVYFPPKEGPSVIAFVTFDRPTAVVRALQAEHTINGNELHVQAAETRARSDDNRGK